MKKLFSIIIAAAMIAAIFTTAFAVHASEMFAFWVDWYTINGEIVFQTLTPDSRAENYVVTNPQTYDKKAEAAPEAVGFLGWAMLNNGVKIDGFAYMIDDEEPVYDDLFIARNIGSSYDRRAELANAGFPDAEGYWIFFDCTKLAAGSHTATFVVRGEDGDEHEMFSYAFTVTGDDETTADDDTTAEDVTTDADTETDTEEQIDTVGDDTDDDTQTDAGDAATDDAETDGDTKAEDPATDAPATDAETEAEEKPVNPKTADAAIIAIASVAAIALAGVVIAKKAKK